jgi:hypothetical protein
MRRLEDAHAGIAEHAWQGTTLTGHDQGTDEARAEPVKGACSHRTRRLADRHYLPPTLERLSIELLSHAVSPVHRLQGRLETLEQQRAVGSGGERLPATRRRPDARRSPFKGSRRP